MLRCTQSSPCSQVWHSHMSRSSLSRNASRNDYKWGNNIRETGVYPFKNALGLFKTLLYSAYSPGIHLLMQRKKRFPLVNEKKNSQGSVMYLENDNILMMKNDWNSTNKNPMFGSDPYSALCFGSLSVWRSHEQRLGPSFLTWAVSFAPECLVDLWFHY